MALRTYKDRTDRAVFLVEELGQEMLGLDLRMTRAVGALLRRGEGFLTLCGETVQAHGAPFVYL